MQVYWRGKKQVRKISVYLLNDDVKLHNKLGE